MSKYDKDIFNSDLDAFKQSGTLTGFIVFSGTMAPGGEFDLSSNPVTVQSLDFSQILFDNSYYHPGRYRNLALENATMVYETTNLSELQCNVGMKITGNTIRFTGQLFNPYDVPVTVALTQINFLCIPYQATL